MSTWTDYLKQFDKAYAEAEDNTFGDLPEGKYPAKILAARLKDSKKGHPMVEFEILITNGKYQKRKEWKYHLLHQDRIKFLKWDLQTLGLDLENFSDLPSRIGEVIDLPITLEIENKKGNNGKEYRNQYIKKYDSSLETASTNNGSFDPFADNGANVQLSDEDLPF